MQPAEVIGIKNLVVGYGEGAMSDFTYPPINANAYKGEMVALVGRNGAGKSTLLRTISRLQPMMNGEITVNGATLESIGRSEFSQLISFIPAEPVRLPNTTVSDFITLARYPYHGWFDGLSHTDTTMVGKALKAVNLFDYRNRFLDRLSDGERQRVMVAFAIAQDTPVILMDEPTAFLDLPSKFEIVRLLREQTLLGKTVIISTHDLQTAFGFVDTIWLMLREGIRIGSPEDLVLTGAIDSLMDGTLVKFDMSSGQFKYTNSKTLSAYVSGSKRSLVKWTAHALERLGYHVSSIVLDTTSLQVEVMETEGKIQWCIENHKHKPTFDSLRNLCLFIKLEMNAG
ncbi:MAG TPA: ABC transporter ATP-binding protein [Tenuifilaceae bacterium]|nr:ABC transporter ATP-binding protein [Tenuifilaceae bacterium]